MPRAISMTWSEGVSEQEAAVFVKTVDDTLKSLYVRYPEAHAAEPLPIRAFGNWIIPALAVDRPYGSTQWYIDTSYVPELRQVIAPTYLELVRKEPWQRADPHFDLALLDQDLTDFPALLARMRPNYYSLGSSLPGLAAVLSVYHVRRLADEDHRHSALRWLVSHHLGHALGVPAFSRQETVQRRGLEMHCTHAGCAMRHASTLEELAELALVEEVRDWPYCPACTHDLLTVLVRHTHAWS